MLCVSCALNSHLHSIKLWTVRIWSGPTLLLHVTQNTLSVPTAGYTVYLANGIAQLDCAGICWEFTRQTKIWNRSILIVFQRQAASYWRQEMVESLDPLEFTYWCKQVADGDFKLDALQKPIRFKLDLNKFECDIAMWHCVAGIGSSTTLTISWMSSSVDRWLKVNI